MEKLTNSSPLMEIVDRINKLIENSNNSEKIITSFSNDVQSSDTIIINSAQLKQGYTLTMTTTGLHRISLEGSGVVQVIINESNTLNNFKYEISDKDKYIDVLLANQDKVFFKSEDINGLVKVRLEKTILQSFVYYVKKLEEVESSLKSIENLSFDLQLERRKLDDITKNFNRHMTVISNTQKDIQSLSNRVSRLEGK